MRDLEYATEVDFEEFKELCLPRLPREVDVASISSTMEKDGQWPVLQELARTESKNAATIALACLFNKAVSTAKGAAMEEQMIRFEIASSPTPSLEGRLVTFENNAYFVEEDATSLLLTWYNVAFPLEVKEPSQQRDDVSPPRT